MTMDYDVVLEARAIARGVSGQAPTVAHLRALVALCESIVAACDERSELIVALLHRPCGPRLHAS